MKKFLEILFWVLTDSLLIFSLTFLPSWFSIFCFIGAILFAPIEEWQNILKKLFKKPLRAIIIAICVAFIIAEFPITRVINGIYNVINPAPVSSNFQVYYGDSESYNENPTTSPNQIYSSESSDEQQNTTEEATTSIKDIETTPSSNNNEENQENTDVSSEITNTSKSIETDNIVTNGEYVFRTPSGKRYHFSETCGGKNSYEVSFDEAIDDGLTPCKKCVK